MSDGSPQTLIDTTVFSNLAAVGRLALLRERWTIVHMAQAVYQELQNGLAEGYTFLAELERLITPLHVDGWLKVVELDGTEELSLYRKMPTPLHEGEAESLAIAKQRGWSFLTDDKLARRVAGQIDVQVIGTLGILAQSVRRGTLQLEEANGLLGQMKVQARYHTPVTDLATLINTVGEG